VARLAVDQRQAGISLDLLTMDTAPEIVSDLVVLMALRHTVVGTNVIGVQPADNHLFVLSHRQQRMRFLHTGAAGEQQR